MKEILKTLAEAVTLPPDSYPEQDIEFVEIFVEEIEEIFAELHPLIEQWMQSENDVILTEIRRHFHTLKGSGRMVGAKSSAELAWTVEDTLNRVINQTLALSLPIKQYVQLVFKFYFFKLADDFRQGQLHHADFRPLVLLGQQLQQQQSLEPALEELLHFAADLTVQTVTGLEADYAEPVPCVTDDSSTASTVVSEGDHIAETLALFMEEAEEHLATIDQFLAQESHSHESYNALIRALHTLRGSSAMAHVDAIFEVSTKVEHLFKTLLQEEILSQSDEIVLLSQYSQFIRDYLHLLAQQGATDQLNEILQCFNQAWETYIQQHGSYAQPLMSSHGLVSQLLQLDVTELLDVEFNFENCVRAEGSAYLQRLIEQAEQLLQHTQSQATVGLHRYTEQLQESYQMLQQEPTQLDDDIFEIYDQAHQQFIQLFDALAAGQRVGLDEQHQHTLDGLILCIQHVKQQQLQVATEEAVIALPDLATR